MTGSAFSLSTMYPGSAFRITQGTPVLGGLKAGLDHYCCPACMSWMFTRPPSAFGDLVNVRTTMLDAPDVSAPFIETYTSEKLPWAQTQATHSFDQFPPGERFGALLGEFAELNR
jgi:hypothetical protein